MAQLEVVKDSGTSRVVRCKGFTWTQYWCSVCEKWHNFTKEQMSEHTAMVWRLKKSFALPRFKREPEEQAVQLRMFKTSGGDVH